MQVRAPKGSCVIERARGYPHMQSGASKGSYVIRLESVDSDTVRIQVVVGVCLGKVCNCDLGPSSLASRLKFSESRFSWQRPPCVHPIGSSSISGCARWVFRRAFRRCVHSVRHVHHVHHVDEPQPPIRFRRQWC